MEKFGVKANDYSSQIVGYSPLALGDGTTHLTLNGMNLEGREILELLRAKLSGPQIAVLYQTIKELKEFKQVYSIRDIIEAVERTKSNARWNVIASLESLADSIGVFSKKEHQQKNWSRKENAPSSTCAGYHQISRMSSSHAWFDSASGRRAESDRAMERARQRASRRSAGHRGLRARAAERAGAGDEAEATLSKALKQEWNDELVRCTVGCAMDGADRRRATAEGWLKTRPNDATLLLALGSDRGGGPGLGQRARVLRSQLEAAAQRRDLRRTRTTCASRWANVRAQPSCSRNRSTWMEQLPELPLPQARARTLPRRVAEYVRLDREASSRRVRSTCRPRRRRNPGCR